MIQKKKQEHESEKIRLEKDLFFKNKKFTICKKFNLYKF